MPLLGGVRPPIAALLCALLAVAALTALGLGTVQEQDVPQAVRDAERRIAEDAAESVGTSIDARATAVRRSAASAAPAGSTTPGALLRSLVPARHPVRGGVLLDPRTGGSLAASGETVPLTGVDVAARVRKGTADIAPRLVSSGNAEPRVLLFARVPAPAAGRRQAPALTRKPATASGELLLVVSEEVDAPAVHGRRRTGLLVDRKGKVLATTTGTGAALAPNAEHRVLPAAAADAVNTALHTGDASGSVLGDRRDGLRGVTGWASVAAVDGKSDASGLGLTILTLRDVPPAKKAADQTWFALVAAGALVVIAVLVTWVLWGTTQRPLLRLHLSAARLARGSGDLPGAREELARPVPVAAFGEPARAGRALESIRRQLLGQSGPVPARAMRRSRSFGVRAVVLVCALLIAAWSVPLLFLLNRVSADKAVPAVAVADQQARTEAAADRVRWALDRNRTDLAAVASAVSGAPRERATEVLRRDRAAHPAYRSLYVLDRAGAIVLRVGKQPLRPLTHAPTNGGITQVSVEGRIPVIAAYARIPADTKAGDAKNAEDVKKAEDAKNAKNAHGAVAAVVVAEIRVKALDPLVTRQGLGSVWLTDERHRVLAASVDFEAFHSLPSRALTLLATKAEAAPGGAGSPASAVLRTGAAPGEGPSIAAAAPLARTGPAAGLGWRVVSARPVAALNLSAYQVQARTMLAGLLALSLGAACLSWLHIVVVRPLRDLTEYAERLAGGDRRTVLYPFHHDECGSVTRSLELLRQALVEQDRGGGAAPNAVPAQSFPSGSAPRQQRTH